ncbi:hypothetical protein CYLTODRAFT_489801 [Cylindrobasidium torrendii FP15055 ss-10]|uniref:Uncharacterized protein n=1 Tax=Cylindrobasidium torrendii FP15055 ss-10 TaxID=1314674 RepID=A0A0D7BFP0_9AGAR|nr:hypothetical protein CYLTODRAFT_489801 [Cylindrobasidium torrendii FP15055 ss-10]
MMAERPGIRRKSSAQNLLTSFGKPSNINTSALSAIPMTPTMWTPMDPDTLPTGTSVEYIRDLVQKRIITLTYMRNMYEGQSHWFHTIFLSQEDLEREFNNAEMKKRTWRFTVLGMSLSSLLDIHNPPDLYRNLIGTLTEWEQAKEENTTNSKLRQAPKKLFRNRASGGKRPAELYLDAAGDSSYLITPTIPFQLDYHHTLIALLDVLSEVYSKISRTLGISPFPRMMGPLGPLSPHPGVADLVEPGDDLFTIVHPSTAAPAAPPPVAAGPDTDVILKIDAKLRKITGTLLKELDHLARNVIQDELASLDPRLDFNLGGAS